MALGSLKDLYLDEIADLIHMERQALPELQRLAGATHAPELREALARHADVSRLHVERLELIQARLGASASEGRSPVVIGLLEQVERRLADAGTTDVRDAAIIGAARRLEHYQMAAYGCARAYARRLDRDDDADLLETSLAEEGIADHRLTEIAEAEVHDAARTGADLHPGARGDRLRYVDVSRLDTSRLCAGPLRVQDEAGHDLGRLGGVVLDTAAGRPAYVVLDARGVFPDRRRLIPASQIRFDDRERVLRIDADQDIVSRYPSFEPTEFQALPRGTLRGSGARLADLLARTAPSERGLEWLMTGVWVTVPPERAGRLNEQARSSANDRPHRDDR